jgi:hypothetical protein
MEIILENTKNKLNTVERLLDYLSDILFSTNRILDSVCFLSDTGTRIYIKQEALVKRNQATEEELICGVYVDLDKLVNRTNSYLELKKTSEFNFSYLDTYEELESLSYKTNFEKSFLLLLGNISNLEKHYEKIILRIETLIPKINIVQDDYLSPKYFSTKFPISDHQLEIFFESDLQLIKDRIKLYLKDLKDEITAMNKNEVGEFDNQIHKNQIMALVIYYTQMKFEPNKTQWFIKFRKENNYTHRLEQTYNKVATKKGRIPKLIKYETQIMEHLKDNPEALKLFQIELEESKLNL